MPCGKNCRPPYFLEKVSVGQWKLDLVGINVSQITDCGVLMKNIEISGISTFLDKSYPSYRRDGKVNGFMTGVMLK